MAIGSDFSVDGSGNIRHTGGTTVYSVLDQEVENFFLRFAKEIRVLEPNSLVEQIKTGLENGKSNYN